MKIKEGYVLNEIGDMNVAVYVAGDGEGLNGFVNLNKIGVFLWQRLEKGCSMEELVSAVTEKYDVDEGTAAKDAEAFISALREKDILCE